MRQIRWVLMNGAFAVTVWLGLFQGHENAQNVVLFVCWFLFLVSLSLLSESAREAIQKAGRPMPLNLDWWYDVSIVIALVWCGWWITGIAYLLHALLLVAAYGKESA